jgi:hypothetical protein
VTNRAQRRSQYGSPIVRPQLIEEARQHQRRRRQMVGAVLIATLGAGCLIVGVVFVDAGGQGKFSARSATTSSKRHTSPAPPKNSPSTLSPSNVVVLNPATGDVIAANKSERAAAAFQAAQKAADEQAVSTRSNQPQGVIPGQEASQVANAEAQAAAAAAAATHR